MLALLVSIALAAPPDSVEVPVEVPAEVPAVSEAALRQQVAGARALLEALHFAEAGAVAHAAGEPIRSAGTPELYEALRAIWVLSEDLERAWAALEAGDYRGVAGLSEPPAAIGGRLPAYIEGLTELGRSLERAEVALVWARFDAADDIAHAAALRAWSMYLDGLLSEPQLHEVEARAQELRDRAGAPINRVRPGARGVATLAIQYTDLAGEFSPELYAFTRALTYIEGTGSSAGYWTEVGNRRHPESTRVHPGAANVHRFKRTGFISDAFGRYQMLSTTWATWAEAAGVPVAAEGTNEKGARYYDISPEYQDLAVLRFLQREGVEELLLDGDVRGAVNTWAARQWSSVPGGSQPNQRTWRFYRIYDELLEEERAARGGTS